MSKRSFYAAQLTRRLGFTIVAVGAAVLVGLVTGSSLLAAGVGVAVGLAVAALLPSTSAGQTDPVIPAEQRRGGQPMTWSFNVLQSIESAGHTLSANGMCHAQQSASESVYTSGSQWRTRLRGGYFVEPSELPVAVRLSPAGGEGLRVQVEDRLRVGVRDRALEARYSIRAAQIRKLLNG